MPEQSQGRVSVVAFFVITYILSWTCWIPLALLYPPPMAGAPVSVGVQVQQILGNYGPTLAALLMLALSGKRGELKGLLARLRPRRVDLRWLLVALLYPLGVLLPAMLVYARTGGRLADLQWGALLPSFLLLIPVSGLGEELGWRGYALPRLQVRHGVFGASAIVGLIWALWHLPVFLWCSPLTGAGLLAEYALYTLILVSYSVVLSRVYNAARGRLCPVVLLHAAITATGNHVLIALSPGRAGAWAPYLVYVLSVCGVALLVTRLQKAPSLRSGRGRVPPVPQVRAGL